MNSNQENKELNKKCAPTKEYKEGSCFSLNGLKEISKVYNEKNKRKVKIDNNKYELIKQLEEATKNECNGIHKCIIKKYGREIANKYVREDVVKYTLRADGTGAGKKKWLSTTHIVDVLIQYEQKYPHFLSLGAVPADFLELKDLGINKLNFEQLVKDGKTTIGMVINLDEHWKSGSHWVAWYCNLKDGQVYYFDSYGEEPSKRTKLFTNKVIKYLYFKKYGEHLDINKIIKNKDRKYLNNLDTFDIRHNTVRHQYGNSDCGVYSINFILRMLKGETFDYITKNITKDETIEKCRGVYFNNVDSKTLKEIN
jgi:hypothetical protein